MWYTPLELQYVRRRPSKLYEGSRVQIQEAVDVLVKRAIKSSDMREDLDLSIYSAR